MSKKLTMQELIEKFADLFDGMPPCSPDEIEAELRMAGYNPEMVGKRMCVAAEKALEKAAKKIKAGLRHAGSG